MTAQGNDTADNDKSQTEPGQGKHGCTDVKPGHGRPLDDYGGHVKTKG
jgi:hypothetical protein